MLALALLFNAILLAPEARIERVPVNDLPFHIGAAQVLGHSIAHGEPFMDPWVSQWSLGFPLWRVYQPLPHLVAAAVIALSRPFASPAASFALFYYLLLVLLPASTYLGARLMGLNPIAAGLASILILAPNEMGDFSRYGLSYGAYVWRGSGLYTELFAIEVMLPALGLAARAIDSGRRQTTAAIALALCVLSHLFFGYIAFVSTAVWGLAGPRDGRSQRIARAVSISAQAMLLLAWFIIPMMLVGSEVNRSRWDAAYKFDSYGAPFILNQLFSGQLLDFGRLPILTSMAVLGSLVAAFKFGDSLARRLLTLTAVWLALFFGRETWGHLLILAGIPNQFHLHRLEAAFELFAVLLAAWGLEQIIGAAMRAPRLVTMAVGTVLGSALLLLAMDRAEFLRLNTMWGERTLAAFESERSDLDAALADIRTIVAERPGRVSAGKAEDWGWNFRVGEAHVYDFLSMNAIDQASYLSHTIPVSSDYMVLRDEKNRAQEDFFAIRAVLAPITIKLPPDFKRRSTHGPFAVYESSPEGYFSLADIGARYDAPRSTWFDLVSMWLRSWMLRGGDLVALDPNLHGVPPIGRGQPIPNPDIRFMSPRGRVTTESRIDGTFRASMEVLRPCYGFIKITYFPGLVAQVDGNRVPLIRVAPDFGAFPLTPGHHEVEVRYQPGPLKPLLFIAGIVLFILAARWPAMAAVREDGEDWLRKRLEDTGAWLTTDRVKIALALAVLILLFTRALLRGQLVDGHDATEYPPQLTEFAKALDDGQFPPVWAPDLGNGHGQPLLEFASPLPYLMALPFYKCGLKLADSLQFGLAILFAIGATAVYLIGRRMSFSPIASIGAAAAWLFAPYQALDMYVSVRMAESSALAMAPVALLGVLMALDRPTIANVAIGACAIGLMILGQSAIAMLMLLVLAVIVVVRSAISEHPARTAASGGAAIAGGLGLSACFWLPALLESAYVKTELLRTDFFNWSIHIISPWQLFWGRWGFGYSVAGPNDGISFSLGLIHIALGIAGAVIGIRALNRTRRSDALVFAGVTIAAAWLATEWSSPVWARVATLQYLVFPWRTLSVCALTIPILALYAFERIGAKLTVAVIVLLVLVNLPHTQPKGYRTYDEEFYSPASIAQNGITTSTREEYEPRWVQARIKYTGDGILTPTPLTVVRELSRSSTRHEYAVTAPALVTVRDSTYYYPGWTVLIDGHETAVSPAPVFGAISFQVPPGNHTVTIELRPTMVRRIAPIISMLTLGILLIALAAARIASEYLDTAEAAGAAKNPDSAPAPAYLLFGQHWNKLGESPNLMTPTGAMLTAALGAIVLLIGLEFIAAPPATGPSGNLAGLFAGVVMLAIVGYTFARYSMPIVTDRGSGFRSAIVILAVIAAAKILLLPFFPGFAIDVNDYQSWALRIASVGPAHTYEPGFFLDYPPGYLYGLWVAGWIARAVGASGELLRVIVESPAIVGDFVLAALVFAFVRRERSSIAAIAVMLMVALNPALLYDTVVWGQSDSVFTFAMLLSIAALMSDQYELCFAIAAISVLIKPQGLMLLPVLSLWMIRYFDPRASIRSALAFAAVALIGIAPFQIGHPWNWIIALYSATAAFYHETSVNAFNLLALVGGLRMPDSDTIAAISYYTLGMTLLVPLYAFAAWIVWTGKSKQRLLFASFITLFGFFMLAPRMHERYIYPAIALAASLALEAPVMTAVFAILSFTGLVNLAYILHTLQQPVHLAGVVGSLDSRDGVAMAVSALNLAALAMAVYYGATRIGVLPPKVAEQDVEPAPESAPARPV